MTICDAPDGARRRTWNRDGVILFAAALGDRPLAGLRRPEARRSRSTSLRCLRASETTHRWPLFLPDGRHFLYIGGSHSTATTSE